jgi:hypothetical protein
MPSAFPIAHDDPVSVSADPELAQGMTPGQSAGETSEGTSKSARRNSGLCQLSGGAEENQILEGEAESVVRSALRGQEPGPGLGAHLRFREAQQPGDVASGERRPHE